MFIGSIQNQLAKINSISPSSMPFVSSPLSLQDQIYITEQNKGCLQRVLNFFTFISDLLITFKDWLCSYCRSNISETYHEQIEMPYERERRRLLGFFTTPDLEIILTLFPTRIYRFGQERPTGLRGIFLNTINSVGLNEFRPGEEDVNEVCLEIDQLFRYCYFENPPVEGINIEFFLRKNRFADPNKAQFVIKLSGVFNRPFTFQPRHWLSAFYVKNDMHVLEYVRDVPIEILRPFGVALETMKYFTVTIPASRGATQERGSLRDFFQVRQTLEEVFTIPGNRIYSETLKESLIHWMQQARSREVLNIRQIYTESPKQIKIQIKSLNDTFFNHPLFQGDDGWEVQPIDLDRRGFYKGIILSKSI